MQNCWKSSQNHIGFIVLPKNKTGIYASDINGMAVTNNFEANSSVHFSNNNSIRSPTATINNTRLNSAYTSNSVYSLQRKLQQQQLQEELEQLEQQPEETLDNRMSVYNQQQQQREVDVYTPSKQPYRRNSSARLFKRTPIDRSRGASEFKLAPASTQVNQTVIVESDKAINQQILAQKSFRPSTVFKRTSKFLKVSGTESTPSASNSKKTNPISASTTPVTLLTSARTVTSLRNKYETESVISKTVTITSTDEEHDNNTNNQTNGDDSVIGLNYNHETMSSMNDPTSKVYPSLIKSKFSMISNSHQRSNTSFTSFSRQRTKSNLVNEILQQQPYTPSKTPSSLMMNTMNESSLIIDHVTEADFLKLLKQYRQTKDPQIFNQLATPVTPAPIAIPSTNVPLSIHNDLIESSNLIAGGETVVQQLRMPKTNNLSFDAKTKYSTLTRYYDTGEYMAKAYLQPAATNVSYLGSNPEATINKTKRGKSSRGQAESTFFVNYINNKYKIRKYDKLMSYLMDKNSNRNNSEQMTRPVTQHQQHRSVSTNPKSASIRDITSPSVSSNVNNRFSVLNLQASN